MKKIKDVLNVVLTDDSSDFGGICEPGETVKDFLIYSDLRPNDSLEELNKELQTCGINRVKY